MAKTEIIIDYPALINCYATLWSYGEICVGCHCCDKNREIRRKARLEYWKELLKEDLNFKFDTDPKMKAIQEKNMALNIELAKKRIKYYKVPRLK